MRSEAGHPSDQRCTRPLVAGSASLTSWWRSSPTRRGAPNSPLSYILGLTNGLVNNNATVGNVTRKRNRSGDGFEALDLRGTDRDAILVRQELGHGWVANYEICVPPRGIPVIASIAIEKPLEGPAPESWAYERERRLAVDEWGEDERQWLRAEDVRRLKPGQALSAAQRLIAETAEIGSDVLSEAQRLIEEATGLPFLYSNVYLDLEADERIKPGKRRTRTDLELAKVAAMLVRAPTTGRDIGDIAKELHYAPGTVRYLIHQARERGLLLPKNPGQGARRVKNELTDKAVRLLEEQRA